MISVRKPNSRGSAMASCQLRISRFWMCSRAFGNLPIEPMWSKWAWLSTMSVTSSGATPISASMRRGDTQ